MLGYIGFCGRRKRLGFVLGITGGYVVRRVFDV